MGDEVEALEMEIATKFRVEHAVACASGSDALVLALSALGIGRGDEVITTPFTFIATAEAIARVGATPVFVDIDLETYNIGFDERAMESCITPRTKAILPVHLYGQVAPMDRILAIARRCGLAVVEDTAQAIGARDRGGAFAGTLGDAGALSFFPSKNLGGAGDGGMLLTRREDVADRARSLRLHGRGADPDAYERIGLNSRLDAVQAAVLRVKLSSLDVWTATRVAHARRYSERLSGLRSVIPPAARSDHVYNQYTLRVSSRDRLRAHLQDAKIDSRVYYPRPLHLQPCFQHLGGKAGDLPNAERASAEVISIPISPELSIEDLDRVSSAVRAFA